MPSTIRGSDNFDTAGGNAVKAWVNFNGTGTVAIRASFNVSSITDNGVGDYTVNFTTAMPDANYSASGSAMFSGSTDGQTPAIGARRGVMAYATNAFRLQISITSSATLNDAEFVNVAIFR